MSRHTDSIRDSGFLKREINKLLKRVSAEKIKYNHKECIELYNIIGGLYTEIGSYDEAIHYHKEALNHCKLIGDRLATAIALRYIGEAWASLGDFHRAVDYIQKYLELAEKTNNNVEIQRAVTTLGRVFLMQAQDSKDKSSVVDDHIKDIAIEAEKRFERALSLAQACRDLVDEKEFAQMRSGLLINIGLVKDICGHHGECVSKFNQAIELCRIAKLKEDLYRCQIILAGIYRTQNNIKQASKISEEAFVTAKQIGKKITICEALIEKGMVKILLRDFHGAKRAFAQAYLEKSPSQEDHAKAIRLTKLAHLVNTNYEKISQPGNGLSAKSKIKVCDKLGDLFVGFGAYKLAVEFYKRAFTEAKLCASPKSELARILYSIAETYSDDGQFAHALICYEKELTYRQGNNAEECKSLIKIGQMHEYLGHDSDKVCQTYNQALEKANQEPKLIYHVLKEFVPYLKRKSSDKKRISELEDKLLNIKSYEDVMEEIRKENEEEEAEDLEDEVPNIDDVITDDDDDDEVLVVGRRRTRGGIKKFKPNEVGDTPLHDACIKGDLKRVVSLIEQGHAINPSDNAGWIPLHEACNHGHREIVEVLLENGADVNNRGLKGTTPLHDAATNGHFEIMRSLIRHKANVIALTDSGETVLSCLKDFKERNYSHMTNEEMSEYKSMENELIALMDRCGFSLMSLKPELKASTSKSAPVKESHRHESSSSQNFNNNGRRERTQVDEQDVVREYRDTIGTLKRRKVTHEKRGEPVRKTNLPATHGASISTSASTKEWLIDDVSREKLTTNKRSRMFEMPRFSDSENSNDSIVIDDNPSKNQDNPNHQIHVKLTTQDDPVIELDSDHNDTIHSYTSDNNEIPPNSDLITYSACATPPHVSNFVKSFDGPYVVHIDGKKLLIPSRNKNMTLKNLKESIVERYSVIARANPRVSLALRDDPECLLYDSDLCEDVIRGPIIAHIISWALEPMTKSYLDACKKIDLQPLVQIEHELARFQKVGNKLDLAYVRIPKNHIKPFMLALSFRDFKIAELTGSPSLFNCQISAQSTLDALLSWRQLVEINMNCVGLRRQQFEIVCESKVQLNHLESLNISHNIVFYKCKEEFKNKIEQLLHNVAPNLKLINLRKNLLLFVKSLDTTSGLNLVELLNIETSDRRQLDMAGVFEQNDFTMYST